MFVNENSDCALNPDDRIPVRIDYFKAPRSSAYIKASELRQFIKDNFEVASIHEIYEDANKLYRFFVDVDSKDKSEIIKVEVIKSSLT